MWFRWTLTAIIALGFVACGYYLFSDWDRSILGLHAFRQSQTAISAYWMFKDGITFNYQTPVLGKPWEIPFEAPFYQIMAVLVVKVTGMSLDYALRLVSVAFWIGCLWPLTGLLRLWVNDALQRWAIVLMIWACPIYLYWTNSLMMESTALFFSLVYLLALFRAARAESITWFLVALVLGVLCGLQKATTLLIALVPAVSLVSLEILRRRRESDTLRAFGALAIAILVPIAAVGMWTAHADAVKTLNPIANHFITSEALNEWNFGTMDQRISSVLWLRVLDIEAFWGAGRAIYSVVWLSVVFIGLGIWFGPHRWEISLLTLSYFTGPLVFPNLFEEHEYYYYECNLYLQLAIGLGVMDSGRALLHKIRQLRALSPQIQAGLCCIPLVIVSCLGLRAQQMLFVGYRAKEPTAAMVRQAFFMLAPSAGDPNGTLLIYGWDWDPSLPYYTGRKAIMDKFARPLDDPAIKAALDKLGPDENISAMVIVGPLVQDVSFATSRARQLHLEPKPVVVNGWAYVYMRQK